MAASTCNPVANPCGTDKCPATLDCLFKPFTDASGTHFGIIPAIVYAAITFIGIISVAMLIYTGFKYITAQADKKAIDSAQKTLQYTIIGFMVVILSFFFLNVIGEATGVRCIEPLNVFQKGLSACQ
jgi:hypothetical protein